MNHPSLVEPIASKCKHFTGIHKKRCRLGIAYTDVRDTSGSGPYSWPCVATTRPCRTTCERREFFTEEEVAANVDEIESALSAAMAALESGKCHHCGAPIEPSVVVGRCKYGACGHRIGQVARGDAP